MKPQNVIRFLVSLFTRSQTATFVNSVSLDRQWVQLAPFGDFDNASGMQRHRPEDARAIVNEFDSMLNLPQRKLGLPWYIGHPDYAPMKDRYTDTKAYGRIMSLGVREDVTCPRCKVGKGCPAHGLFANVAWNGDGQNLIGNQSFHGHSVNWRMRKEGAVWRPFSLKSVGFTNEPQLPVVPVTAVNEEQTEGDAVVVFVNETTTMNKLTDYIKKLLGMTPEQDAANEDEIVAKLEEREKKNTEMANEFAAFKKKQEGEHEADCKCGGCAKAAANEQAFNDAVVAAGITVPEGTTALACFVNELAAAKSKLATESETFANERGTLTKRATEAEAKVGVLAVNFANERKEVIKMHLDGGQKRGVITAADRPKWEQEFANEEAFGTKLEEFQKLAPKVKTASVVNTAELGKRNAESRSRQERVQEAVNEVMTTAKVSYDTAYQRVKKTKPALFSEMKQPEHVTTR